MAELELELIHTQMAQKPMLKAEVYARALRASQNVKRAPLQLVLGGLRLQDQALELLKLPESFRELLMAVFL
jgi:hypothetical protein